MHGAVQPLWVQWGAPAQRLAVAVILIVPHAGAYPAGHCSSLAPPNCSPASVALADTEAGGLEGSSSRGIARRCRGPALTWRPLLAWQRCH